MRISDLTKTTLLLRINFEKKGNSITLKPKEFRELDSFLNSKGFQIDCLIKEDAEKLLYTIENDTGLERNRLISLLNSGLALGMLLDKWSKLGIWVLSIYDEEDYPLIFKERYRDKCPLLLFGCGDKSFLQTGGLGIVGPRNAPEWALSYAKKSAERAAEEGVVVISGGAKGIDTSAMEGCLEGGGRMVNILPSNLDKEVLNKRNQKAIREGQLTLISAEKPEAGWSAGLAMARNKFIYLLSSGVLVVNCDKAEGGTWSGASECLLNNWSPVYVKKDEAKDSGNTLLLSRGALEDRNIELKSMKKPSFDFSKMKVSEIAVIEKKASKAVKAMLTKRKLSCLDYPLVKEKKVKTLDKKGIPQKDFFN